MVAGGIGLCGEIVFCFTCVNISSENICCQGSIFAKGIFKNRKYSRKAGLKSGWERSGKENAARRIRFLIPFQRLKISSQPYQQLCQ